MAYSPGLPLPRWLTLFPAFSQEHSTSENAPDAQAPPAPDALRGVSILVVDDEQDARRFLSLILRRYGAEVRVAGSAREAFELYQQSRPSLLLSDIAMPESSGEDLIRWIRDAEKDIQQPALPAVAVTALTAPQHRDRILASGFNLHVGKPFDAMRLVAYLTRLLGLTR